MIRARIPATSANLGPGFDCMGLALSLWNTFELRFAPSGLTVETYGEGAGELSCGTDNMIVQTMCQELDLAPDRLPGLHLRADNRVPCVSGLGSSSTAVLAGLIFAHALRAHLNGDHAVEAIDRGRILARAVNLEGHGDNVAPAMLGGLILVMPNPGEPLLLRTPIRDFQVVVVVPTFHFPTSQARAALPASYEKADTIFNMGRAMFVLEALRNGDDELLGRAMEDRVHEPYRLPLIPGAIKAKRSALEAGATAVALSGAGPGIIAFARAGHREIGQSMIDAFAQAGLQARMWVLDVLHQGAQIEAIADEPSSVVETGL